MNLSGQKLKFINFGKKNYELKFYRFLVYRSYWSSAIMPMASVLYHFLHIDWVYQKSGFLNMISALI